MTPENEETLRAHLKRCNKQDVIDVCIQLQRRGDDAINKLDDRDRKLKGVKKIADAVMRESVDPLTASLDECFLLIQRLDAFFDGMSAAASVGGSDGDPFKKSTRDVLTIRSNLRLTDDYLKEANRLLRSVETYVNHTSPVMRDPI